MAVTIQVTFDELPEGERTRAFPESQHESLLNLEERYRAYVAERLPNDQKDRSFDSRHFWYNSVFQPHRDRIVYDIATTAAIALNFRPDTYLVSTPRKAETHRVIDPEKTVKELLTWLHEKKMIASVCCYEVLNSRGVVLKEDRSLYDQGALPYCDVMKKEESHLRVRMKAALLKKAYIFLVICALAGLILGWAVGHFGHFGK